MTKPLDRLTLLETFVRIADTGSISAAARDLGVSQPTASRQLAELEVRLKAQLARRTTHSLTLTEAGIELLAEARVLLDRWEALEERHLSEASEITGSLKVVAPVALGQRELARIAWRFQSVHPGITFTWLLEDRPIRFSEVGCDCWIRVGAVPDDTLVVRELGVVERLLVAAADHFRIADAPEALNGQPLVALEPFEGGRVPLHDAHDNTASLSPPVKLSTNNIVALKEAALTGLGIAVMPRWFVAAELASGKLIDVLPDWRAPALPVRAAYLAGRYRPRRLRAFVDLLEEAVPDIDGVAAPT